MVRSHWCPILVFFKSFLKTLKVSVCFKQTRFAGCVLLPCLNAKMFTPVSLEDNLIPNSDSDTFKLRAQYALTEVLVRWFNNVWNPRYPNLFFFCNFTKTTVQQANPPHAAIVQVCGGEEVGRIYTSFHNYFCDFLYVQPRTTLWMSVRRDCLKMCAGIHIFKRLSRLYDIQLFTPPSGVAAWNRNKHFCLPTWLQNMLYELVVFKNIQPLVNTMSSSFEAYWGL